MHLPNVIYIICYINVIQYLLSQLFDKDFNIFVYDRLIVR